MPRFRLVVLSAVWVAGFFYIFDRINISLAAPKIIEELDLSGVQMGMILSIYFWGFILGNPLGGIVVDNSRWVRWITFATLMGWSLLTALTAACTQLSHFYLVRGLLGFTEGVSVPCFQKLHNNWLLPEERGRYYGVFEGCVRLGAAFGLPLIGWLINLWTWRGMFYASSVLTFAVGVYVFLMVRDRPQEHPWVSQQECDLIHAALEKDRVTYDPSSGGAKKVAFGESLWMMARDGAFWLLLISYFLILALYFANMTWLPGYLVKERGFSIIQSGVYLILPYLGSVAGTLVCGYIGDKTNRRSLVAIGFCILACPAMIGAMMATTPLAIIGLLTLALFLSMGATNSLVVLFYELFPPEAFATGIGLLVGVGGGVAGLVAPLVIGILLDITGSFFWGFTTFALANLVAGGCFVLLMPRESQVKSEKAARVAFAMAHDE